MSTSGTAWTYAVIAADVALALAISAHIILKKENDRAAVAWLAMIWLSPLVGAFLYWLFGINRIARRALKIRGQRRDRVAVDTTAPGAGGITADDDEFLQNQVRLVQRFRYVPDFTVGNLVRPLRLGDEAYPEMLAAIRSATTSIGMSTYIFNNDPVGRDFATALGQAVKRGVEVRVLVDGIGALYSRPPVIGFLRRRGVTTARFLASFLPTRMPYLNTRNHRKILVVDGRIGFAGGMNIKVGHLLSANPPSPTADVHFRVEGPVVADMVAIFADDWGFTTHEALTGAVWFPPIERVGKTLMRCMPSGPNEVIGSLRLTLLSALTQVHKRLRIATPYFLPDEEIGSLLAVAALRGVEIDIVLPGRNNLFFVQWAQTATFRRLIQAGCRIWLQQPLFDHSKLAVADGRWVLFGSSNWDSRSLRLNFEVDCECFDPALAQQLDVLLDEKIARSEAVTLESLQSRDLVHRFAEGVARLFRPFI